MRPPVCKEANPRATNPAADIALEFTIGYGFVVQLAPLSLLLQFIDKTRLKFLSAFPAGSPPGVSIHHT